MPVIRSDRREPNKKYGFTPVPLEYDSDYVYLPGLCDRIPSDF